MTVSIPTLPPESLPAGAAAPADTALATPAEGFDQFLSGETPEPGNCADSAEDSAVSAPASEQAAALAASLLWAPLPLLVETPSLALPDIELSAAPAPASSAVLAGQGSLPAAAPPAGSPLAATGQPFAVKPPAALAETAPVTERAQAATGEQPGLPATPTVDQPASTPEAAIQSADTTAVVATVAEAAGATPGLLPVDHLAARRSSRLILRGEKIADEAEFAPSRVPIQGEAPRKTFISHVQQEVRGEEEMVGTDVAKPDFVMPSTLADQKQPAERFSLPTSPVAHAVANGQPVAFELPKAVTPVERAHDAIAGVLQVVEIQEQSTEATKNSVNLDFNFGEERLAVRVEFRDGAVRAHFNTTSAELRSALAQEWQHVAAAPENVLRFAEPVFTAASRAEQSAAFNADGGAQRQQQQAQEQSAAALFSSRPVSGVSASTSTADAPEAPRLRSSPTALHLQAVA